MGFPFGIETLPESVIVPVAELPSEEDGLPVWD